MTKKLAKKKGTAKKATGTTPVPANDLSANPVLKYLNADFTRQLIEHMHRAKKAALKSEA